VHFTFIAFSNCDVGEPIHSFVIGAFVS
jgi:hypothetical protein